MTLANAVLPFETVLIALPANPLWRPGGIFCVLIISDTLRRPKNLYTANKIVLFKNYYISIFNCSANDQ